MKLTKDDIREIVNKLIRIVPSDRQDHIKILKEYATRIGYSVERNI